MGKNLNHEKMGYNLQIVMGYSGQREVDLYPPLFFVFNWTQKPQQWFKYLCHFTCWITNIFMKSVTGERKAKICFQI